MINILVIDDHPVVRQGIKQIIAEMPDIQITSETGNSDEALNKIKEQDFDVVTLDISMPGKGGLEIIKEIKDIKPDLPVLVLTIHPEIQFAIRMIKLGASGYLTKDRAPIELIEAIRMVSQGHKYISSNLSEKIFHYMPIDTEKLPHEKLSSREYQIMLMIASGNTLKEIAQEIFISIKTVSTHRRNILHKMQMTKNIELVHYAIKNDLIDL